MLSLGVLQAVFILLDLYVKVLSCKELHEHTENNLLVNLTRNSSNSSLRTHIWLFENSYRCQTHNFVYDPNHACPLLDS